MDRADVVLNMSSDVTALVELVGLYGFAWQTRLGNKLLWRWFVALSAASSAYSLYEISRQLANAPGFCEAPEWLYMVFIAIFSATTIPTIAAIYLYAFHREALWANEP